MTQDQRSEIEIVARCLDSAGEAQLVAMACSQAPAGRKRWPMQLLKERLIQMEIVESIDEAMIGRTLKNTLKPWLKKCWCIPPEQDAAFVCAMEDTLESMLASMIRCTLKSAYLSGRSGKADPRTGACTNSDRVRQHQRVDNEYKPEGTCSMFMAFEPLTGKRRVLVRDRRTCLDYAQVIRLMCDEMYP